MLKERQKSILNAAVDIYIRTALPVASSQILEKYQFPFSTATIRNNLNELEKNGYLYQPHTSAGRIPTNKGYRFFVDYAEDETVSWRQKIYFDRLLDIEDENEFMASAVKLISDLNKSLVIGGFLNEPFYKSGLGRAFDEPEFNDTILRKDFAELIDQFEILADKIISGSRHALPQIFIGGENPIKQARHYGMIVAHGPFIFSKKNFISVMGPLRMDYKTSLALLKYIQNLS